MRVFKVKEHCPKCNSQLDKKHICPKCKKSIPYNQTIIVEVDEPYIDDLADFDDLDGVN